MDVILQYTDEYLFTPHIYPASWDEENCMRRCLSLFIITWSMGYISYLLVAVPSYFLIFDHEMMKHPNFQKNQLRQEIWQSSYAMPIMFMMSTPIFYLEITGATRLRDNYDDAFLGYFSSIPELIGMILVVDFLSYTFHRAMHHKLIYKYLHKEHHKWKVATPFASHAFHPVDGFLQQMPYHVCVILFPVNKYLFVAFLVIANIWAVSIHDGEFEMPDWMKSVINGPAHHTDHHMLFNYNYGQFFTVWDRIAGSYHHPSAFEGKGPLDHVKKLQTRETAASVTSTDAKSGVGLLPTSNETDSGMESAGEDFDGSVCSFASDDAVDDNDSVVAPFGICNNCSNIHSHISDFNYAIYGQSNCIFKNTEQEKTVSEASVFSSDDDIHNIEEDRPDLELVGSSNCTSNLDSTETLIRRRFSVNVEHSSMNEFSHKRRRFSFRG